MLYSTGKNKRKGCIDTTRKSRFWNWPWFWFVVNFSLRNQHSENIYQLILCSRHMYLLLFSRLVLPVYCMMLGQEPSMSLRNSMPSNPSKPWKPSMPSMPSKHQGSRQNYELCELVYYFIILSFSKTFTISLRTGWFILKSQKVSIVLTKFVMTKCWGYPISKAIHSSLLQVTCLLDLTASSDVRVSGQTLGYL